MNLDLLGLFQSPPGLRFKNSPCRRLEVGVPATARLRYPLRTHLYRICLTCLMVCLAIATIDNPLMMPWSFFWIGILIGCAALYWRGISLNYGPDALELCWRLHKLARICWSQLFYIEVSQRGLLILREKDHMAMTVDPDLEEFDALCAVILRRAPAEIQISPAASELLLAQARLDDSELIKLYGPHFLAEPQIHSHLWDPVVDPYESWHTVATVLALRLWQARQNLHPFVIAWGRLGRAMVVPGAEVPADCLAWARAELKEGLLTVEVDYQGNGVRIYQGATK